MGDDDVPGEEHPLSQACPPLQVLVVEEGVCTVWECVNGACENSVLPPQVLL